MPRHLQPISCSPHIDNLAAIFKAKLGRAQSARAAVSRVQFSHHECAQPMRIDQRTLDVLQRRWLANIASPSGVGIPCTALQNSSDLWLT
jgi:hypothetical protein